MNLLLTSGGVTNASIRDALVELLGKPIAESTALCIPTAMYGHPMAGPGIKAWEFISGNSENPMVDLGWKSVGVLELTALPSLGPQRWMPWLEATDVLLVNGGETMYLAHWLRESGLADVLPGWPGVWVGLSAGSVVMSRRIGRQFVWWPERGGDDTGLGLVDFAFFPHTDHPDTPGHTMADAERWAADITGPAYAADQQSAFVVVDGQVRIVTEGVVRKLHD